ncbi:hypothetical protein [Rhizobium lentis]|uniref:Uncharacterized protein n=1 Tax=Rhizobium lentis TaxID=1138194 RepID=A0A7W8UMB9_9HYPH|nr:hypothetical protein [Rhizobium lentis]MBB4574427.1 hypothetical protein [Rhizobium lentis]MBB5550353.1 hypothetical protein [Rhizobium lentis]MBB5560618.1 hypothetical protein [Rhizobium lentis]MBB5567203.1 hypothetical protein [Rhizobium lentis]
MGSLVPTLVALSAVQAAAIMGMLVWLVRKDDRRRKEITAAIEFALGLNLFRQRNFLRLFIDGEDAAINRDYPEWADYRARFYALEGF